MKLDQIDVMVQNVPQATAFFRAMLGLTILPTIYTQTLKNNLEKR